MIEDQVTVHPESFLGCASINAVLYLATVCDARDIDRLIEAIKHDRSIANRRVGKGTKNIALIEKLLDTPLDDFRNFLACKYYRRAFGYRCNLERYTRKRWQTD